MLLAGGALVLFIGVAAASRWIVGPLAAAIEKPIEPFTRGTGELAREETRRNPARTATTAAALTVGVALIAFVAVMAQGLRASTGTSIRNQVTADYVITPQSDVLAPDVQHALSAAGIHSASVRAGTVHVLRHQPDHDRRRPRRHRPFLPVPVDRRAGQQPPWPHSMPPGSSWPATSPPPTTSAQAWSSPPETTIRRHPPARRARRLRLPRAQPAAGRHDHHHQSLRPQLHHPRRPSRPRRHRPAGPGRPRRRPGSPQAFPDGADPHPRRVHHRPAGADRHTSQPVLRPARAVRGHQPVRDRQHPGPVHHRADPGDRRAARPRHDQDPAAPDDPSRERDHRPDRGGHRDRGRPPPRRCSPPARCPPGTSGSPSPGRPSPSCSPARSPSAPSRASARPAAPRSKDPLEALSYE